MSDDDLKCLSFCVSAEIVLLIKARIIVLVTIYRRLLIGRDGHLDQSEAYYILQLFYEDVLHIVKKAMTGPVERASARAESTTFYFHYLQYSTHQWKPY